MSHTALQRVLGELKQLEPKELEEVERAMKELRAQSGAGGDREAALRVLETSGLVRAVRRPWVDPRPVRAPVPITGKPLSETVMEERR